MNDLIKTKDQDSLVAWYAVFVLLLAYVLSFVDRIILSLLVTPIKEDLGTTDAQMGLLMGFAFAIFYTIAGIPIAKYSDVKSRRLIIASLRPRKKFFPAFPCSSWGRGWRSCIDSSSILYDRRLF